MLIYAKTSKNLNQNETIFFYLLINQYNKLKINLSKLKCTLLKCHK